MIQGIGAGFIPKNLNVEIVDEVHPGFQRRRLRHRPGARPTGRTARRHFHRRQCLGRHPGGQTPRVQRQAHRHRRLLVHRALPLHRRSPKKSATRSPSCPCARSNRNGPARTASLQTRQPKERAVCLRSAVAVLGYLRLSLDQPGLITRRAPRMTAQKPTPSGEYLDGWNSPMVPMASPPIPINIAIAPITRDTMCEGCAGTRFLAARASVTRVSIAG